MKLVLRIVWYIYFFIFYCWRFNFLKSIFFLFYPNFKKSVTAVQPNYFGTCNVFLQFLSLRYPSFCASHPNLWRIALHQIWRILNHFYSRQLQHFTKIFADFFEILTKTTFVLDTFEYDWNRLKSMQETQKNLKICFCCQIPWWQFNH